MSEKGEENNRFLFGLKGKDVAVVGFTKLKKRIRLLLHSNQNYRNRLLFTVLAFLLFPLRLLYKLAFFYPTDLYKVRN